MVGIHDVHDQTPRHDSTPGRPKDKPDAPVKTGTWRDLGNSSASLCEVSIHPFRRGCQRVFASQAPGV